MEMKISYQGVHAQVDPAMLPMNMDVEVFVDLGENSNSNKIQKLQQTATVLGQLNEQGAGMTVKPEAPAVLATQLLEAMGLDSNDFLEDYTTDEFKQRAEEAIAAQSEREQQRQEMENRKAMADVALAEANVDYTHAQSQNTVDDNAKQLAVSIDKSYQEWEKLKVDAFKEGTQPPQQPDYMQVLMLARQLLDMNAKHAKDMQQGGQQNQGGL